MPKNHTDGANQQSVHALSAAKQSISRQLPNIAGSETSEPSKGDDASPEKKGRFSSWTLLAPLVGAATLYFAYLAGVVFYQTHLARFGISPGAFPQGRSDYLVLAVFATMTDLNIVLDAVWKPKVFLSAFGTLFIVGVASFALVLGATALGKIRRKQPPMSRRPKLLLMYLLALPLGGVYVMFAVPALVAAVMVFPIELGVSAANAITSGDIADYKRGCAEHAHGKYCFNLVEGKEVLATGFIIQQSKDTIALWDKGIVKVLPLEKRGLISVDAVTTP